MPMVTRVAARHLALLEAQRIVSLPPPRVARHVVGSERVRRELTASVLAAFGEAVVDQPLRMVHANIGRRLEQLWKVFQSAPRMWEDFKTMVGLKATSVIGIMRELPGLIRDFMREGQKELARIGQALVTHIPVLRMYLDVEAALPNLGKMMARVMDKLPPSVQRGLQAIGTKARSLAEWLDELIREYKVLKPAARFVSAAIFAVVWFNVVEISWDIPEILRGFIGGYSFMELVHSLPESGVGFLLAVLFPGIPGGLLWNALLPITVALRLAWLVNHDLAEWRPGGKVIIYWDRMGLDPSALR